MDKKTLLALVLMAGVFGIYTVLTTFVFKSPTPVSTQTTAAEETKPIESTPQVTTKPANTAFTPAVQTTIDDKVFTVSTDIYDIVFDPKGGSIADMTYKVSDKDHIDLLLNQGSSMNAFDLYWGSEKSTAASSGVDHSVYQYTKTTDSKSTVVTFTQRFVQPNETWFDVTKKYEIFQGESAFRFSIKIENSVVDVPPLDTITPYTLLTFPQIGPDFKKLGGNYGEYRNFKYYDSGKVSKPKMKNGEGELELDYSWTGVEGKYFMFAIKPLTRTMFTTVYMNKGLEMEKEAAAIFLRSPSIKVPTTEEVFIVYAGPKNTNLLKTYNSKEKNSLGASNLNLEKMVAGSFWWFLAQPLKFFLEIIYKLVQNFGVAIIILSIGIKLILWPLTNYGETNNKKMQALNPKIEELRKKYANDPQKANVEMNALYQREKVNPIMGCLPMLLQLPIFLAVFDIMNIGYEFRGAVFIPGWINDLSQPEFVLNWGLELPFLGSYLRLLPIIYLGSQLLTSLLTPMTAGSTSSGQMKFMTFGLPIVFFFILYGMPSGLLIFWTTTNILGIIQNAIMGKIQLPWANKVVKS